MDGLINLLNEANKNTIKENELIAKDWFSWMIIPIIALYWVFYIINIMKGIIK